MRADRHARPPTALPFSAQSWLAGEPELPRAARPTLGAPALEPRTLGAVRRLLVAMRGTSSTADAVRAAATIAQRHGARVEVLSVFEPRIPYPLRDDQAPIIELPDRPAADAQLHRVHSTLRQAAEQDAGIAGWEVYLEVGQTATRIARAAQQRAADLIVLGRGRQGAGEWMSDRVALKVATISTTPVLAVPAGGRAPRRLMLAVGLDELTLHVARAVRRLFPDLEALDLVHVRQGPMTSDAELDAQFARIALVLGFPEARLTRTVLEGEPVSALLAHAARTHPDCIAAGLHGVTVAERSLARNLSLHLLDEAGTGVLVVPK